MEYKDYVIESDRKFGMYQIRPISRGTVIKELRSSYSTIREALTAIDLYGDVVAKKRKRNGQTDSGD